MEVIEQLLEVNVTLVHVIFLPIPFNRLNKNTGLFVYSLYNLYLCSNLETQRETVDKSQTAYKRNDMDKQMLKQLLRDNQIEVERYVVESRNLRLDDSPCRVLVGVRATNGIKKNETNLYLS